MSRTYLIIILIFLVNCTGFTQAEAALELARQYLLSAQQISPIHDAPTAREEIGKGIALLEGLDPDTLHRRQRDTLLADLFHLDARILHQQGNLNLAIEQQRKAVVLVDRHGVNSKSTGEKYYYLATLFFHTNGKSSDYLPLFEKATTIFARIDAPLDQAESLRYIGLHYHRLNNFFTAARYLQEAVQLLESLHP